MPTPNTFVTHLLTITAATLGLPDQDAAAELLTAYAPRDAWEARQAAKIAMLDAVLMDTCQRALDPELPPSVAAALHRSIVGLERASRLALAALQRRQSEPLDEIDAQDPMQSGGDAREPSQASRDNRQDPMQSGKPRQADTIRPPATDRPAHQTAPSATSGSPTAVSAPNSQPEPAPHQAAAGANVRNTPYTQSEHPNRTTPDKTMPAPVRHAA